MDGQNDIFKCNSKEFYCRLTVVITLLESKGKILWLLGNSNMYEYDI